MYRLFILLSILKNVAAALTAADITCNTNKLYPVGLGNTDDNTRFEVLDFFYDTTSSPLTYIAVGARCKDKKICPQSNSKSQPLIRLYKESLRQKVWSKYFSFSDDQSIESIVFLKSETSLSLSYIVLVTADDYNIYFIKVKASDGSEKMILQIPNNNNRAISPQSLYFTSATSMVFALRYNFCFSLLSFTWPTTAAGAVTN